MKKIDQNLWQCQPLGSFMIVIKKFVPLIHKKRSRTTKLALDVMLVAMADHICHPFQFYRVFHKNIWLLISYLSWTQIISLEVAAFSKHHFFVVHSFTSSSALTQIIRTICYRSAAPKRSHCHFFLVPLWSLTLIIALETLQKLN